LFAEAGHFYWGNASDKSSGGEGLGVIGAVIIGTYYVDMTVPDTVAG
jgi:hypothetical protein